MKQVKTGFQIPQTLDMDTTEMNRIQYLLYLPVDYDSKGEAQPLMLFLHGAGERGDNIELVKKHGPPKLLEQGRQFPFIVVSPQCPAGAWWPPGALDLLLKEICGRLNVDENRIYLTGLSMGGYGTWALAVEYPERFAAIAPVCGGGDPEKADTIKHLPAWVFHGGKDTVVPIERSREMVDALKKAGADVQFTIYPEAGHDSWTETYNNPELYEWFLKHRRSR
ncbi:prolyl oligopeptidase family serine peptidase [candidate division KSB1 bacterium]